MHAHNMVLRVHSTSNVNQIIVKRRMKEHFHKAIEATLFYKIKNFLLSAE